MLYINFDIFNLHLKNTNKSVNIIIKIDPILFFFFFYVFVVTNILLKNTNNLDARFAQYKKEDSRQGFWWHSLLIALFV